MDSKLLLAPVVTIDGPSSSGKGTLCKYMAKILKWNILDSGAIYRALALSTIYNSTSYLSEKQLIILASNLDIKFICNDNDVEVFMNGKNITYKIRMPKISNIASQAAIFPKVRKILLHHQRLFRKSPGLVADGRDMSTVVFPDALVKIYLSASQEERAYRRMLQLERIGYKVKYSKILSEIKDRDNRDYNRAIAPLFPSQDALILDSTNLTIGQLLKEAIQYTYRKLSCVKQD